MERSSFLRAIIEAPEDDLPRLIFADWLDECGESERAEFIRIGCELVSRELPAGQRRSDDFYAEIARRSSTLIQQFEHKWGPKIPPSKPVNFTWKRGFVSEIHCTLGMFCGGACERCGNRGSWILGDGVWGSCVSCKGNGRNHGIAGVIFREHPVERVVLTDRHPTNRGWIGWGGARNTTPDTTGDAYLPGSLFSNLRGGQRLKIGGRIFHTYETDELAQHSLSAACVSFGRYKAG